MLPAETAEAPAASEYRSCSLTGCLPVEHEQSGPSFIHMMASSNEKVAEMEVLAQLPCHFVHRNLRPAEQ
ncbi:hypothetical protein AV530_004272 [Patagioenas fasciata monilis]|uniref:Uncharacterized protein n=1 Tax=Patagioenas fasciata monilis TaxID=372326 RepID=A0A1V4K8T8_PATFA|nr:hypothetical protein AV530_004272 [Patagioenas fasciata monilis]